MVHTETQLKKKNSFSDVVFECSFFPVDEALQILLCLENDFLLARMHFPGVL